MPFPILAKVKIEQKYSKTFHKFRKNSQTHVPKFRVALLLLLRVSPNKQDILIVSATTTAKLGQKEGKLDPFSI